MILIFKNKKGEKPKFNASHLTEVRQLIKENSIFKPFVFKFFSPTANINKTINNKNLDSDPLYVIENNLESISMNNKAKEKEYYKEQNEQAILRKKRAQRRPHLPDLCPHWSKSGMSWDQCLQKQVFRNETGH